MRTKKFQNLPHPQHMLIGRSVSRGAQLVSWGHGFEPFQRLNFSYGFLSAISFIATQLQESFLYIFKVFSSKCDVFHVVVIRFLYWSSSKNH